MQCPVCSLARFVRMTRNLDETIVETEIMPQRVLPTLRIDAIVRESVSDKFVDIAEGQHLFR